ncbi:hypothetical protein [Hydrogenophaga sp. 5NK40-0174]|uniref:hypothetical protein n=1 Tax=Hydrogenophaga sp. 5NK40-0174 TaxID=3127649 RepID=UPI00334286B9
MDDTDAFFTHTIVGEPRSLLLGRRLRPAQLSEHGVEVPMELHPPRLSQAWQDWIILRHDDDAPGTPRPRPGAARRFMERYALLIAMAGLIAIAAALALTYLPGVFAR